LILLVLGILGHACRCVLKRKYPVERSMNNPTPMPSSLLAHRYQVLRVLGDGGFGTTYLAEDAQMPSRRKCVVKQLKPVENNPQIYQLVKERFQREAAILETLGDGFGQIPHLYAYFSEGDQFFLVEEWVEGETLTQKLQREGLLPEMTVRSILSQTLPVLAYIHQKQMVHRDIKPDNIILRQSDRVPVLIDFGAVKETMSTVVNSQGNSSRSIVVGTPGFMPSEQMAGRPLFSSDLYSLGFTAIYLLTGRIPQDLETDPATGHLRWQHLAAGITLGFAAIIDRSIQMNPRDRFQTADQMLMGLQSLDRATPANIHAGVAPTDVHIPQPPAYQPPAALGYPSTQPAPTPQYQAPLPQYQVPPQAVPPSSQPTVQVPGYGSQPTPLPVAAPVAQESVSSSGEWKKAGLIGGVIGLSILGGAMMLRAEIGDFIGNLGTKSEKVSPSIPGSDPNDRDNKENDSGSVRKTTQTPTTPSSTPNLSENNTPPQENGTTDAQIIGAEGTKNIRSGPGSDFGLAHTALTGDRVLVLDEDYDSGGFLWYLIYFPKTNAEGWIAGHLLKVDGLPLYQPPTTPTPTTPAPTTPAPTTPPVVSDDDTNATIVGQPGSKNIRSGPGTNFANLHIAYPGDRIEVTDSEYDSGGFQWYEVYFPKSGASGWIAAQLVQLD
jgi:serine/threonine protein kinase, bacterial